jgi:anti-anti-sigma factor
VTLEERSTGTGWVVIVAAGSLDARTSPDLENACAGRVADGVKLAVDLSGVKYLSSSALRVLLALYKTISARGGKLAIVAPKGGARHVFTVSGFSTLFSMVDSPDELP